jgi:hypothetical protein
MKLALAKAKAFVMLIMTTQAFIVQTPGALFTILYFLRNLPVGSKS